MCIKIVDIFRIELLENTCFRKNPTERATFEELEADLKAFLSSQ
jgi:hypothetical protein